jgi:hypothetical protein
MTKRPSFLSNKQVSCDFCGEEFTGNINRNNLFMCDKCVRWLCVASKEKRVEFYHRFDGDKERQKVIKRFINEETLLNEEAKDSTGHTTGSGNNQRIRPAGSKIWQVQGDFFLDKAGVKVF